MIKYINVLSFKNNYLNKMIKIKVYLLFENVRNRLSMKIAFERQNDTFLKQKKNQNNTF